MKDDIIIPQVNDVYVAVVNEYNDIYKTNDWNAYIINNKDVDLEMILIVSKGYTQNKETSLMRHKLEKLPKKSYAKIELMQEDVLALNNEFKVTFLKKIKCLTKPIYSEKIQLTIKHYKQFL